MRDGRKAVRGRVTSITGICSPNNNGAARRCTLPQGGQEAQTCFQRHPGVLVQSPTRRVPVPVPVLALALGDLRRGADVAATGTPLSGRAADGRVVSEAGWRVGRPAGGRAGWLAGEGGSGVHAGVGAACAPEVPAPPAPGDFGSAVQRRRAEAGRAGDSRAQRLSGNRSRRCCGFAGCRFPRTLGAGKGCKDGGRGRSAAADCLR
jgi:hypothetical protein